MLLLPRGELLTVTGVTLILTKMINPMKFLITDFMTQAKCLFCNTYGLNLSIFRASGVRHGGYYHNSQREEKSTVDRYCQRCRPNRGKFGHIIILLIEQMMLTLNLFT